MNGQTVGLIGVAAAFAMVNGANDGGALTAVGISVPGVSRWVAVVTLAVAAAGTPLVLGTAVATTLASGLVRGNGGHLALVLATATGTAIVVTAALTLRGLPTSVTLSFIGSMTGVGLGAGLFVSWSTLVKVLVVAAVAPLAGIACAALLGRLVRGVPAPEGVSRRVRWLHLFAFCGICLAYGVNDGQKMLAVFALAAGAVTAGGVVTAANPLILVAIAACFLLGTVLGSSRYRGTVVGGVVPTSPDAAVTTELSAAAVAFGSATLGAPVSMTQAMSGALVGTGVSAGRRNVRWRPALRIAAAWAITLPTSFCLAAGVGLAASLAS